MKTFEIINTN